MNLALVLILKWLNQNSKFFILSQNKTIFCDSTTLIRFTCYKWNAAPGVPNLTSIVGHFLPYNSLGEKTGIVVAIWLSSTLLQKIEKSESKIYLLVVPFITKNKNKRVRKMRCKTPLVPRWGLQERCFQKIEKLFQWKCQISVNKRNIKENINFSFSFEKIKTNSRSFQLFN